LEKIFVTGASGLLGSNLIRVLLERHYNVKVLVRSKEKATTINELSIEFVEGDIRDKDLLVGATVGCDYIVNVAALTSWWPSKSQDYFDVNFEGTKNIVEAALVNNAKKFIQVSTASCFNFGSKKKPGQESDFLGNSKHSLDYINSKKAAQDFVLGKVRQSSLPGIVVNPTFMIGAYDKKPTSGSIIIALSKGVMPGITGGGKNWVYAKDVAVGICNALEVGRIGECYILGNENLSYAQAIPRIAKSLNKKVPKRNLPNLFIKLYGLYGSAYSSIFEKKPKMNYAMAKVACDGHYYSAEKARVELGLPQTSLEYASLDAYKWFHENGYLE